MLFVLCDGQVGAFVSFGASSISVESIEGALIPRECNISALTASYHLIKINLSMLTLSAILHYFSHNWWVVKYVINLPISIFFDKNSSQTIINDL